MGTAINACSLALIDASCPLNSIVIGCTVGYAYQFESYEAGQHNDENCYIVDISYQEGNTLDLPFIEVAVMPQTGKISFMDISGRLHDSCMPKMMDKALSVASEINNTSVKLSKSISETSMTGCLC